MTSPSDHQRPEERAEDAARDLADRGQKVTARAVRRAAGVSMTIAAAAARAWNDAMAEDDEIQVPAVPGDVIGRFEAIWSDTYRAAVSVVSPERDRLAADLAAAQDEISGLTHDVATLEKDHADALAALRREHDEDTTAWKRELDEAVTERDQARESLTVTEGSITEMTLKLRETELRAEAAERERDDLRDNLQKQIAALLERTPGAPAEPGKQ